MRIFLGHTSNASFVKRDLKILQGGHQVVSRNLHHKNPFRCMGDVFAVMGSQVVVLWFASLYALPTLLAAVLFGKKIAVIVGGYEAANMPELGYGQGCSGIKRQVTRLMLLVSDLILAVSRSSMAEICQNLDIENDRVTLLYHGFEDIAEGTDFEKQPVVINVGRISRTNWLKKGIKSFIEIAEQMPDVKFIHVGQVDFNCEEKLNRKLPENLTFAGQIPFERIGDYLAPARVYLQLSKHESFGCSVAEAMLFEAIPIVTDVYSLPEVVGDTGVVLSSTEQKDIVAAVRNALEMPPEAGQRARQRILDEFSYEKREIELLRLIDTLKKRRGKITKEKRNKPAD